MSTAELTSYDVPTLRSYDFGFFFRTDVVKHTHCGRSDGSRVRWFGPFSVPMTAGKCEHGGHRSRYCRKDTVGHAKSVVHEGVDSVLSGQAL